MSQADQWLNRIVLMGEGGGKVMQKKAMSLQISDFQRLASVWITYYNNSANTPIAVVQLPAFICYFQFTTNDTLHR